MEKYGTIPKRFTKAWWSHYIYYYKFHAIAVVFFVFMISSIIYSNVTRTKIDLYVSYIGLQDFDQEKFTAYVESEIDEITGNNKKNIDYVLYTVDNTLEDGMVTEAEQAYHMKLAAELQGGECDLYLITKSNASELIGFSNTYMDVTEIVGKDFPEEKILRDGEGHPFAVSLKDNKQLEEMGLKTSGLYLSVRQLYDMYADDETRIKMHENSIKAAKLLIGV